MKFPEVKLSEINGIINKNIKIENIVFMQFNKILTDKRKWKLLEYKQKGYEVRDLLSEYVLITISGAVTICNYVLKSFIKNISARKDTFYRLLKHLDVDWTVFLHKFIYSMYNLFCRKIENGINYEECALIVDDTILEKTGKCIELASKVFDHTTSSCKLGYKMLSLAFYDGYSINPISFSLHREKGKNKNYGLPGRYLLKQYRKPRNAESKQFQRVLEADKSKPEMLREMLKSAIKNGFVGKYFLADKWFFSENLVVSVRHLSKGRMHYLGACKMDKKEFEIDGKKYKSSDLKKEFKHKYKRCKEFNTKYFVVYAQYKDIPVVLFFNKGYNKKEWDLLITTDTTLKFIDAIRHYSKRWTIEVMFRDCKQYLNIERCSSQDFDSQVNHVGLSLILFILLSFNKRFNHDLSIFSMLQAEQKTLLILSLANRIWDFFVKVLFENIAQLNTTVMWLIENIFLFEKMFFTAINFILSDSQRDLQCNKKE